MDCAEPAHAAHLKNSVSDNARAPYATDSAIVIDLPGDESIRRAIELACEGFRPVPIFNASLTPTASLSGGVEYRSTIVGMTTLLGALCDATQILNQLPISAEASPVFVLAIPDD